MQALVVEEGEPDGLHDCGGNSVTRNAAEPKLKPDPGATKHDRRPADAKPACDSDT